VLPFNECHGFTPFFLVNFSCVDPKCSNSVPSEKIYLNAPQWHFVEKYSAIMAVGCFCYYQERLSQKSFLTAEAQRRREN
jgi:hypothetical protein